MSAEYFEHYEVSEETFKKMQNKMLLQIKKVTEKEVQWAVDPVFLLSKEEWSSVASDIDDIISRPYIFCYFLGDSSKQRSVALEYASSKKLKIVTIL